MTVAEFIAELSKFPPDMLILSYKSSDGIWSAPRTEVYSVMSWDDEVEGEFVISSSILRDPDQRDAVLI